MVAVTFKGRLGNQLFQYVFLKYLQSKSKSTICFSPNPHHSYLAKYFDLGIADNFTLGSKLFSGITRFVPSFIKFREVYVQNFVNPRDYEPINGVMYHGYYQSDFWLKRLPTELKLKLRKKYTQQFEREFGAVFNHEKTVVVHIRRTDYMNYGKRDISLPMEYFRAQLYSIENLDTYKVFFVSDDMNHVREIFPAQPNFIFSSNDEITDFQLIRNADIAIISNSTFAWWAAYTCPKKNLVLAPKNWFGFRIGREHPMGIMTDKFDWREVKLAY